MEPERVSYKCVQFGAVVVEIIGLQNRECRGSPTILVLKKMGEHVRLLQHSIVDGARASFLQARAVWSGRCRDNRLSKSGMLWFADNFGIEKNERTREIVATFHSRWSQSEFPSSACSLEPSLLR